MSLRELLDINGPLVVHLIRFQPNCSLHFNRKQNMFRIVAERFVYSTSV